MRSSFALLAAVGACALLLGCGANSNLVPSPLPGTATGSVSLAIVSPTAPAGAVSVSAGRLDDFQFTSADDAPGSPVGHDAVEFSFAIAPPSPWFADVSFGTARTSFAAMTPGVRLPLSAISGLSISAMDANFNPLTFDLSSVPGTFVLHPTLEADGTGTLVLEIDVPPVDVTATGASGGPVTLHFSASLLATQAFVDATADDYNKTSAPTPRS